MVPRPNGLQYKVYKKCTKILEHLWKLLKVVWGKGEKPSCFIMFYPWRRDVRTHYSVKNYFLVECWGANIFLSIGKRDDIMRNVEQLYRYISLEKVQCLNSQDALNIQASFHNWLGKPRWIKRTWQWYSWTSQMHTEPSLTHWKKGHRCTSSDLSTLDKKNHQKLF